jgi:methionyl aminopeptidase
MITLKSPAELQIMRKAGRIVAGALKRFNAGLADGRTTKDIEKEAKEFIERQGGRPAFFDYKGYPGNICISVNNEIVHGIPSGRKIKKGDIVSIDIGVEYEGYYADAAATYCVGKVSKTAKRLVAATRDALYKGIEKATAGSRLSDISHAVQTHAENEGFSVVRAFVGHGIGSSLHEDPPIPNFGEPNLGIRLETGMVLAIEPMINEGVYEINILKDGWTAVTADGRLSAHFEHTVAVNGDKPEILTLW